MLDTEATTVTSESTSGSTSGSTAAVTSPITADDLVEETSIDGMCGVY